MIKGLSKGLLRCGYCHGEAHGLLEGCSECGILLHADCRRALGRCATIGCQTRSVQSIPLTLGSAGEQSHAVDVEGPGDERLGTEPTAALPTPTPVPPPRRRATALQAFVGLLLSVRRNSLPIAVLAACAMGGYTLIDAFRHTSASAEEPGQSRRDVHKEVSDACRVFRLHVGRSPASLEELFAFAPDEGSAARWRGPYLDDWPSSPEGLDYELVYRGGVGWLAIEDPESGRVQLQLRLHGSEPTAACGLEPVSALVRQRQLSRER